MATILYLQSRIRRGFAGGLALSVLIGALCGFACFYRGFMERKETEIEYTYDTLPVTVVVSNPQGTQTEQLGIHDYLVNYFLSDTYVIGGKKQEVAFSSYVKDVCVKTTLYCGIPPEKNMLFADTDALEGAPVSVSSEERLLIGITRTAAAPELNPVAGVEISYFPGWDETVFCGDEPFCIVPQRLLEAWKEGAGKEDGSFSVILLVNASPGEKKDVEQSFLVVGSYSGDSSAIYCSWNTAAELKRRLSGWVTADSLSAVIADNRKLEEFRELLARHFAEVDPSGRRKEIKDSPTMLHYEFAATIHDEELRRTLNELSRNLKMLKFLSPFLAGLEFAVAFSAAFFAVRVRKRDLATARSLGTSKRNVALALFAEISFWGIIGAAAAAAICRPAARTAPYGILAGILLSAVLGTVVSGYLFTGRKSIQDIKEED